MTDEQRPDPSELEWPSEDLAQPGATGRPARDLEWPAEDATSQPPAYQPSPPADQLPPFAPPPTEPAAPSLKRKP